MVTSSHWGWAARDVAPDFAPGAIPRDPVGQVLMGLQDIDGEEWKPPYENLLRAMGVRKKKVAPELQAQAGSRLRTYLVYLRSLGLVYVDKEQRIRVTPTGRRLGRAIETSMHAATKAGEARLAKQRRDMARAVLPFTARHLLDSPLKESGAEYPPNTDIRPYWAILKAACELDGKIHWQEVARVLVTVFTEDDLPQAIATIRSARASATYDPAQDSSAEKHLGPLPEPGPADGNYRDRTLSLLSKAAFKDLLLDRRGAEDGFRYLADDTKDLVEEAILVPHADFEGESLDEYMDWLDQAPALGQADSHQSEPQLAADRRPMLDMVLRRVDDFGDQRIICLVGPAGSGKTSLAQAAAWEITGGDSSRRLDLQFHAGFAYEDFVGGLQPTSPGAFERLPAKFLELNGEALQNQDDRYVVVIDELSRADLSNTLGEVLTYVEYRDTPFWVAGLQEEVRLARNLVILATMNPQDRSVLNMDDAMVRRLRQVPVGRNVLGLEEILSSNGMEHDLAAQVVEWFKDAPEDLPFAQGVFVDVRDEQDLSDLWHDVLRHFVRRGGVSVYPDASTVEASYPWREPPQYAPAQDQIRPGAEDVESEDESQSPNLDRLSDEGA